MITHRDCRAKYGEPETESAMAVWDVPTELELGFIPKKIYCNKDLVLPLQQAFHNIIDRGLVDQLKTWDGCFNLRKKVGGVNAIASFMGCGD